MSKLAIWDPPCLQSNCVNVAFQLQ